MQNFYERLSTLRCMNQKLLTKIGPISTFETYQGLSRAYILNICTMLIQNSWRESAVKTAIAIAKIPYGANIFNGQTHSLICVQMLRKSCSSSVLLQKQVNRIIRCFYDKWYYFRYMSATSWNLIARKFINNSVPKVATIRMRAQEKT